MAKKFSDFGELGELKRLFLEGEHPGEAVVPVLKPVQKPRTRVAVNKSRAERQAEAEVSKAQG